jgi:hypothetical protein
MSEWSGLFTGKHILQSWALGVVAVFVFTALSLVAPSVFGGFTVPLRILAAPIGIGAPDNIFVLAFVGGSLFYGAVCFIVLALIVRRENLKRMRVDTAS